MKKKDKFIHNYLNLNYLDYLFVILTIFFGTQNYLYLLDHKSVLKLFIKNCSRSILVQRKCFILICVITN